MYDDTSRGKKRKQKAGKKNENKKRKKRKVSNLNSCFKSAMAKEAVEIACCTGKNEN